MKRLTIGEGPGHRYDAFLSYNHESDRPVAVAVQRTLQGLGRRFLGRPALRVFRDDTSLSAEPDLWAGIVRALERSRFFVLLACPESADSDWVAREVAWWREHRSADTLLLARTGGRLDWDDGAFTESTDALRRESFAGLYVEEPLWSDLGFARHRGDLTGDTAVLRDAVATLAAPMHGVTKDELESADLRETRRGRRLRGYAVAVLSVLLVVAVTLGVTTFVQLGEARRQTAIATSRAFAAEADTVAARDPVLAAHLALAGYRIDRSAATTAALMRAHERTVGIERFLEVTPGTSAPTGRTFPGAEAISVAASPDGRFVATGGFGDTVRLWEPAASRLSGTYASVGNGTAGGYVEFSVDGRRLATSQQVVAVPAGAVEYDAPDGATIERISPDGRFVGLLAFSRGGGFLVDLASPDRTPRLVVPTSVGDVVPVLESMLSTPIERSYDLTRLLDQQRSGFAYTALARSAARWISLRAGTTLQLRDLSGRVLRSGPAPGRPGHADAVGVSSDGSTVLVGDDLGQLTALDASLGSPRPVAQLPGQIRTIDVSPDGAKATVLDSRGDVTIVDLRPVGPMTVLPGTTGRYRADDLDAPDLVPSPDGRLLLAVHDGGATLWSLVEQRPIGDVAGEPPDLDGTEPVAAFDAAGSRVAVRGRRGIHLVDVASRREITSRPVPTDRRGVAGVFTELLGAGAELGRSDGSSGPSSRSPSGRTEVRDGRIVDVGSGDAVALVGGSGRGAATAFAFAEDDAVIVESVMPDRESEVYQNRLQLWDRGSGALLGEWTEPLAVSSPGDQGPGVAVAGGTTALTVRPDGSIGQWLVSPRTWADRLCEIAGEPGPQERAERFSILGDVPLCLPPTG